jgi:hypothetical protein
MEARAGEKDAREDRNTQSIQDRFCKAQQKRNLAAYFLR